MSVGYIIGSFDLLNVRHLDAIRSVLDTHDVLWLGVYDDATVTDLYGRPPVVPLIERVQLLEHLRGVHDVLVHGSEDVRDATWFAIADDPVPSGALVTWVTLDRNTRSVEVLQATASTLVA